MGSEAPAFSVMALPLDPSPISPNLQTPGYLAFVDDWMRDARDPMVRDALLDLRTACAEAPRRPLRAAKKFLKLRPLMRSRSYLDEHRLRRALERRLEVEITTPDACWTEPLDLSWSSISRVLEAPRRRAFEHGSASWDRIRVRLVAKPH
jgi:hypothetical protein